MVVSTALEHELLFRELVQRISDFLDEGSCSGLALPHS